MIVKLSILVNLRWKVTRLSRFLNMVVLCHNNATRNSAIIFPIGLKSAHDTPQVRLSVIKQFKWKTFWGALNISSFTDTYVQWWTIIRSRTIDNDDCKDGLVEIFCSPQFPRWEFLQSLLKHLWEIWKWHQLLSASEKSTLGNERRYVLGSTIAGNCTRYI